MGEIELILVMLAVMVGLIALANRVGIPYPILLVLGGLGIGLAFVLAPEGLERIGLHPVELDPEIVFLIFLPPILQAAAYNTALRDFRANLRAIGLLSIGLVLLTTVGVAVVAHSIVEGMSWPVAFVLGAIVSPPDAVAATSIANRLNLPRRIVTVLEGESLVNDATALTALRVAVAAVGGAEAFSLVDAGGEFLRAAVGGVAVGLVIGSAISRLLRRVHDTPTSITLTFLTSWLTYILAEETPLHASGVLAVVTVGLVFGRNDPDIQSSRTRLEGVAVWQMVVFLLNGLVFILIGLQLPLVIEGLEGFSLWRLAGDAALVSLAAILLRIAWVFPATYVPRMLSRSLRERDPSPSWRNVSVVAWTGMRGVVSLAAALALPAGTEGVPSPQRELVIFLTFGVILATLVLQGLSLPLLIRALGVEDDGGAEREEAKARLVAAKAAQERLRQLAEEEWVMREMVEDLDLHYEARVRRFGSRYHEDGDGTEEENSLRYERLQQELIRAEREAVTKLRNDGYINDEVLRRVQRDLDMEKVRLGEE